jgi:hypothetical protein
MMNFVALVEDICHRVRRRGVDNGRGDDIWHISVILMLWDAQFRIGKELTYCRKMYIATISD